MSTLESTQNGFNHISTYVDEEPEKGGIIFCEGKETFKGVGGIGYCTKEGSCVIATLNVEC